MFFVFHFLNAKYCVLENTPFGVGWDLCLWASSSPPLLFKSFLPHDFALKFHSCCLITMAARSEFISSLSTVDSPLTSTKFNGNNYIYWT
jgi:hypothetical protein